MKTRILLAATTLVLLSTTAFAGPIPFTSQALGGSPLVQTDLALASDGSSTALAAWRSDQALGGVYAARIGTSGVIDRFAIPLDPDHSVKYGPVAAATSAGFLVVWATDTTIRIRLVGKDGTAGPVTEVPTLTGHNCKAPLIAARADSVVIVSGFCSGYSATLTDVRGVVQQSGFGVGGANEAAGAAVAVADPVGFCVVVATPNAAQPDRDDLIGKRINSNGSTSPPFPVATQVLRVNQIRAVFDGSNDFVLWSDQGGVRSATIAPGANNAVAGGTIINSAVLDFDLANGWLVYAQGDGSHAQRLQSESAVGAPFTIDPNAAVPRVALFTNAALSVWISSATSAFPQRTFGAQIAQGSASAPFPVALGAPLQQKPRMAVLGNTRIAVWEEELPDSTTRIAAGGLSTNDTTLGVSGASVTPAFSHAHAPAICAGSTDLLVVWTDAVSGSATGTLLANRITPSLVVEGSPMVLATGVPAKAVPIPGFQLAAQTAAIAWSGTEWLVTYTIQSGSQFAVKGVRVTASGQVADQNGLSISPFGTADAIQPDVAWDGEAFTVVWLSQNAPGRGNPAFTWISATRVFIDGSAKPAVSLTRTMTSPDGVTSPHIAAGASSSLATWIESFSSFSTGTEQQIARGVLIPLDFGAPRPPASRREAVAHAGRALDFSDRTTTSAIPVWNGTAYAVLWEFDSSAGNVLFQTLVDETGSTGFASLIAGLDRHTMQDATIAAGVTRLVTTSSTEGQPSGLTQRGFWFVP